MKKLLAILLAVVLTLAMAVVAFAAADIEGDGGTKDGDVSVAISNTDPDDGDEDLGDVTPDKATYYVTIDFTGMVFTYSIPDVTKYDPETHEYTGTWDKTSDYIKVSNDSNTSITITAAIKAGTAKNGVTASVTGTANLDSAAKSGETQTSSTDIQVSISGKPTTTDGYTLDTVTLTVKGN